MRRRQAFTLVELLVTIALVTFIMALLSEAFIVGVKTFRDLKALGDMDERLRAATSEIAFDLKADHFSGDQRLSDASFWQSGPPTSGFFRIFAPSTFPPVYNGVGPQPASFIEGLDGDGIPSAVVTDTVLHFTVKHRGNHNDRFYTAVINPRPLPPFAAPSPLFTAPTTFVEQTLPAPFAPDARYQIANNAANDIPYNSQWAEVAYFLLPNGELAGSTPLYTLYRTQLVVAPDTTNLNWPAPGPVPAAQFLSYQEMSCVQTPNQVYFYNPSELTLQGQRAFDPTNPANLDPNTGLPRGSTFVLGDVISFEVQTISVQPFNPPVLGYLDFDTGAEASVNTTVTAIQITIRVWDSKTQLTRQITIVQDM